MEVHLVVPTKIENWPKSIILTSNILSNGLLPKQIQVNEKNFMHSPFHV
jgi:hypothetical protein